jgi:hypothetical protein
MTIVLSVSVTACAGLIVRESDSFRTKTAKVSTRTALGLATLGTSELAMADAKHRDRLRQFRGFLNDSVGRLTLDDAVARWGVPRARHDGDQVIVVQWANESTSTLLMPDSVLSIAVPVRHGWNLELSFGSSSRRLLSWSYREW